MAIFNNKTFADVENDRLLKLKIKMERFTFTVRWQAGRHNSMADTLSRAAAKRPVPEDIIVSDKEDEEREFVVAALEEEDDLGLEQLRERAAEDGTYGDVADLIEGGGPPTNRNC